MNTAQSTTGRKSSQKLAAVVWIGTILLGIAVCIRAAVVASHVDSGWKILGDHFLAGLPISAWRGEPIDGVEQSTQLVLELAKRSDRDANSNATDLNATDLESRQKESRGTAALVDARLRWNYDFDLRDVGSLVWRQSLVEQAPLLRIKRDLWNEKRKAALPVVQNATAQDLQFNSMFGAWNDEQWRAEKELWRLKGWSTAAVACAACAWLLMIVGLAAAVFHRMLKTDWHRKDAKAFVSSVVAWWLAFLITFGCLGLLVSFRPAIKQYSTLELAAAATLLLAAVVAFFWFTARFVRRQGKLPAEARSGLFNFARLAIVLGGTFLMIFPLLCVADRKVSRGIAMTWRDFPGNFLEVLQRDLPIDVVGRNFANAFVQWGIHGGLFLTAALWVFAGVVVAWRSARSPADDGETPTWWNRWREIGARASRTISRSGALLVLLMLVLCLAAATQWLVCLQTEWDKQTARVQNAGWLEEEVAAAGQRLQLQVVLPKTN
jgi:hypothetical protein